MCIRALINGQWEGQLPFLGSLCWGSGIGPELNGYSTAVRDPGRRGRGGGHWQWAVLCLSSGHISDSCPFPSGQPMLTLLHPGHTETANQHLCLGSNHHRLVNWGMHLVKALHMQPEINQTTVSVMLLGLLKITDSICLLDDTWVKIGWQVA